MFRYEVCSGRFSAEPLDRDEILKERIRTIYLDLKSGIPKIRAQYNLDEVMAELNKLAGGRP